MPNKECLIICDGWSGISSPLHNTVAYLSEKGYSIVVEYFKLPYKNSEIDIPKFQNENVTVLLKEFKLENVTFIDKLFRKLLGFTIYEYLYFKYLVKREVAHDSTIILMDRQVKVAGLAFLLRKLKYFYFSLELPVKKKELTWAYKRSVRNAEKIFIQDEARANELKRIFGLKKKIDIVFNSSIGDPITKKNNYFRDLFSLTNDKKIILFTGTLAPDHGLIFFLNTIKKWPKEYVLILHGWVTGENERRLITEHECFNANLFLSENILPFHEKYILFSSVDVGIVHFEPINVNFIYAAGSAGKFFDCLRCGVPVIANNINGMKELVTETNVGVVYRSEEDVISALKNIFDNYTFFQKNCYEKFETFEFSNSFSKALNSK